VIVLDANVVIAFLDGSDALHPRADGLLKRHPDDELVVHTLNLAEVLVRGARLGRAHEMMAHLESIGVQPFEGSPGEALLLAELRAGTGLRLPDCCALMTAIVTGAPLATFDKRLDATAAKRGVRVLE
jgi:predicted nucleic acid-binding protein